MHTYTKTHGTKIETRKKQKKRPKELCINMDIKNILNDEYFLNFFVSLKLLNRNEQIYYKLNVLRIEIIKSERLLK